MQTLRPCSRTTEIESLVNQSPRSSVCISWHEEAHQALISAWPIPYERTLFPHPQAEAQLVLKAETSPFPLSSSLFLFKVEIHRRPTFHHKPKENRILMADKSQLPPSLQRLPTAMPNRFYKIKAQEHQGKTMKKRLYVHYMEQKLFFRLMSNAGA